MGLVITLPFTLTNGTTADASQVMANYNALVAGFLLAAKAGVNDDITALTALVTPLTPVQGGSSVYIGGTSTGSANAQVIATPVPASFSLAAGKRIVFIAGFTNTGATQINVNAQGLTNVFRMSPSGPQALTGGEIIAGNIVEAIYDGTQFELISVHNQFGGFGLFTSLASATTTDLGTIPSHNILITGTTTITAFGSSASVTFPIYRVLFQGALTLTHNGTSLILPGAANITTANGDTAVMGYLGSGNWFCIAYNRISGLPIVAFTNPTVQRLTSGTGATYTTPAGARQLRVRMVGGGGGGGASATNAGAAGTDTSFESWVAESGAGGPSGSAATAGGAGGTGGANGTGTLVNRVPGGDGNGTTTSAATQPPGAARGTSSVFGGAGAAGQSTTTGQAAKANTGSGGQGGNNNTAMGGGGAAGEYVEFIINSPAASYTYTVGGGGAGGAAGGIAGGNGGSGIIIVDEFY